MALLLQGVQAPETHLSKARVIETVTEHGHTTHREDKHHNLKNAQRKTSIQKFPQLSSSFSKTELK